MSSEKDQLKKISDSRGAEREREIKAATRAGVSLTKISKAAGQPRESLIKKLARGGW